MAGRIINPGTRAIYRGKQGIFAPGVGRVGGHDASLGGSSYVRAAYLGAVATRSAIPTKNVGPATTQIQSCSRHISLEAVPFQIEIPNWQVRADTFAESNSGATATCNASIEYPANSGTFTQVLFSGVATGTIGIGAGLLSDQISMAIPVGQAFNVRIFWQGNYEFWFGASTGAFISTDTSRGEFYRSAASGLTDHTMGGAVTDTGGGYKALRPTRIIGMTRKPTILTIGDSRCAGIADTFNDVGNYGEPARIFGSRAGLINVGVQGDSASKFVASHAKRVALGANATHVWINYGYNDLAGARTTAQVLADNQTIAGYFPGKTILVGTISPVSTAEANRIAYNDLIRAGAAGFNQYFDVADVMETARNSGVWKTGYSSDNVHAIGVGYDALQATAFNFSLIR
jgi:hypothetical protein